MKRRLAILGAVLAVVLILGGWVTTTRAHEVSAEEVARAQLDREQVSVQSALHAALQAGLSRQEIHPYQDRYANLSALQPPTTIAFWSSAVPAYYQRRSAALRVLQRDVHRELQRVTLQTREVAYRQLDVLNRDIARAGSLVLDTSKAQSAAHLGLRSLTFAHLPRQLQDISASLAAAQATLDASIQARERAVSSILGATEDDRKHVVQRADAEVSAARKQLSLLGVLTARATVYQAELQKLQTSIQTQRSAYQAAAQSVLLDQEVSTITADYGRTIPAKLIVVSTEDQLAHAYQNGREVLSTPVTTGGPELPTDHGVFHIYFKASPFVFHSPWPPGSPFYYPPTPIQYWMPFDGAEGLHDASWRSNFGPGSNFAPTDLGTGNYILGTHGCVNLPFAAAQFIWDWAPVGTTVVVI